MRQIGDGRGFRQDGDPTAKTIPAPLVLQVLEIRNVALPTSHQVEKPRLLRIAFSDGGKKKILGAEILGPVDQIKYVRPAFDSRAILCSLSWLDCIHRLARNTL